MQDDHCEDCQVKRQDKTGDQRSEGGDRNAVCSNLDFRRLGKETKQNRVDTPVYPSEKNGFPGPPLKSAIFEEPVNDRLNG